MHRCILGLTPKRFCACLNRDTTHVNSSSMDPILDQFWARDRDLGGRAVNASMNCRCHNRAGARQKNQTAPSYLFQRPLQRRPANRACGNNSEKKHRRNHKQHRNHRLHKLRRDDHAIAAFDGTVPAIPRTSHDSSFPRIRALNCFLYITVSYISPSSSSKSSIIPSILATFRRAVSKRSLNAELCLVVSHRTRSSKSKMASTSRSVQ